MASSSSVSVFDNYRFKSTFNEELYNSIVKNKKFRAHVQGAATDFETRKEHDQQVDQVLADLCIPGATWKLSTGQLKVPIQLRRQLKDWTRNTSGRESYMVWAHQLANPNLVELSSQKIVKQIYDNIDRKRPMFRALLKSDLHPSDPTQPPSSSKDPKDPPSSSKDQKDPPK
ncbi:hypothetical protein PIB30_105048 [Stylosanthes scabra]|uniref:Uncharacterized protein n=1 Tax=Stylosanthes scabra TaxID=79078 RepID=A0ABU6T0U1_9FABA|nr:hypothetical protein [Stylosanthes scabra]